MGLTIEVRHLAHGQQRSYGPHVYESEITITGERLWDRLTEGQIRELVKVVVHHYTDEPETGGMDSYYQPRLKLLTQVAAEKLSDDKFGAQREVWRARVETPYCD